MDKSKVLEAAEGVLTTLALDAVLIAVGVVGLLWFLDWKLIPLLPNLNRRRWKIIEVGIQIVAGGTASFAMHVAEFGIVKALLGGLSATVVGIILWFVIQKTALPFLQRFAKAKADEYAPPDSK